MHHISASWCPRGIPRRDRGNESQASAADVAGVLLPGLVLLILLQVRLVMRGLILVPLLLGPNMAG